MKLADLSVRELRQQLGSDGLSLSMPPFAVRIRSDVKVLAERVSTMYSGFSLHPESGFHDFHVEISRSKGLRRWFQPRAEFSFDGARSFTPLPQDQCFTMLEWGLNWCVAAHAHQYLLIHAATIERNGRALVLPAPPGSGKSTLCAGLVHRGWRLLSDELALLDMPSGLIYGMARPVNLKNASISAIRQFAPAAVLTPPVANTSKGTVSLMKAPDDAVQRVLEPARAAWLVLPKYVSGSAARLQPLERAQAFMAVAEQSFNYDVHGERGFRALGRLVDSCETFQFEYSDLNEAAELFAELSCPR